MTPPEPGDQGPPDGQGDPGCTPGEPEHLVFGEDLDQLQRLSQERGLHALEVPEKLIEDELRRKSPLRRSLEIGSSLGLTVALFAFLIPWLTNADYGEAWTLIRSLSASQVAVLFGAWFVSLATIWTFLTHTLPGLRVSQAGVMNLTGSAVANVVPFGGAVGVGVTYAQGMSWGFDTGGITLSVLVSGVWNVFSKLLFPIVALLLLAAAGESAAGLDAAALAGAGASCVAIAVFAGVIRNEPSAARIAARAESVVNATRRLAGRQPSHRVTDSVLDFRHRCFGLVRARWVALTWWMVAYKVTSFLLQLLCVRAIGIAGDQLTWIEVLAAYTLGELLTASPFTPSGLGLVELGSAGLMIRFGAPDSAAFASVLLFRSFTYLLEIPAGALGWLVWATKRSWRRQIIQPGEAR